MAFNLREVFAALESADAKYVVVGGFAVIMHGYFRGTADLDLVVALDQPYCERALRALSDIGMRPKLPVMMSQFADPEIRLDWHQNRNMLVFQLWDPSNDRRSIDVFVQEPFPFEEMLAEAAIKDYDGVKIPIASIRHLIAMKAVAGRPRDLNDIAELTKIAQKTGQKL
jgi:Nucleotidyl transferase AbiEii toxin, Type IV TA system